MLVSSVLKAKSGFRIAALIMACMLLPACWAPREKTPSDVEMLQGKAASFYIENVSGHSLDTKVTHSNWNLPTETYFTFKACAKNSATKQPLIGQTFEIKKGIEVFESTPSTTQGCFVWKERIPFNFLADSKYIFEDRVVRSKNNNIGEINLNLAINPWIKSRGDNLPEAVHHLVDEILPSEFWEHKNEIDLNGNGQSHELWARNPSINIIGTSSPFVIPELSKETGYGLKLDIALSPTIQLKKANGDEYPYHIKKGKFKVFASILADEVGDDSSKRMILNPTQAYQTGEIDQKTGELNVSLKTVITGKPDGVLRLALKLVPEDGPSDVNEFAFVYTLGPYDKLTGNKQLKITQEMQENMTKFSYNSYVSQAKNYSELVKSTNVLGIEPYHFNTLDVKFVRIAEGETATQRTVLFRVEACITNPIGVPVQEKSKWYVKKIKDHSLMPQVEQEEPELLEANDRGCIPWMDSITHKYYQRENYVYPKVQITSYEHALASKKSGKPFVKELGMAVNPWDEKWTFGADIRSYPPTYLEALKKRSKNGLAPTYLQIYDFRYVTIGFRYNIDKFMNLTVKKKVLLRLDPKVLRYSSIIFGRRGTERLRDGLYLMKVAIQKEYIDPASKAIEIVPNPDNLDGEGEVRTHIIQGRIDEGEELTPEEIEVRMTARPKTMEQISAVTKIVRVNDGVIVTPVEFSMNDLRLMKMRSNMFIQLETLDEKALSAAIEYEGYLDEKSKELKEILTKKNIDIDELKKFLATNKGLQFKDKISDILRELGQQRKTIIEEELTKEEIQQLETSHTKQLKGLVDDLRGQHNFSYSGKWKEESEYLKNELRRGPEQNGLRRAAYSSEVIQDMYKPFGLPDELIDRTNRALELNDFTTAKAYLGSVPINQFIERDSGLSRRTFIGPVTFIFNTNGSSMRPTDNLDENSCPNDSCDLLENSNRAENKYYQKEDNSSYEHSPYFGSIRHMQGVHVDELIEKKVQIDKNYHYTMSRSSLLFNYINFFNIDYVSLLDKPLKYFDERMAKIKPECYGFEFESCLKSDSSNTIKLNNYTKNQGQFKVKGLLDRLQRADISLGAKGWFSKGDDLSISQEDLEKELNDFVNNDIATDDLKLRLCYYMSTIYDDHGERITTHQALYSKCKRRIDKWVLNFEQARQIEDIDDRALDVNTKYIVNRTNRYRYRGGKSMNFNVGANFLLSDDLSQGTSSSVQLTSPTLFMFMPSWGTRTDITRSKREGHGIQISSQTFLVMQTAALDLELTGYEVCKMIKWNQDFLTNLISGSSVNSELLDIQRQKHNAITKRLMLCSGRNSDKPTVIKEHYFYFTQHFTDGDMLDPGDLNNHPWLIALRGYYDFKTFISMIEADPDQLPILNQVKEKISTKMFPIDRLELVYRNALPTFTGIHTVVTEKNNVFDYPQNHDPSDSFQWIRNENEEHDFEKEIQYRGEKSFWIVPPGEDPN